MTRRAATPTWEVVDGDCLDELAALPAASIDAIVTDPPYGIDFQGEHWDGRSIRQAAGGKLAPGDAFQDWCGAWASLGLRALKPGGHLAAFGAPRTAHRLAAGIEDAGLQLRDTLMWLYGTGMPKSRRLSGGRTTQLKPAYEPIVLARAPLAATPIERNLKRHGTGALNTDACRVEGRHPANVVLSHEPECGAAACQPGCAVAVVDAAADRQRFPSPALRRVSRLFYSPKASRRERDAGCEDLPKRVLDLFPNAKRPGAGPTTAANSHPTVKPLALMRWLIRLTTPAGGLVLDPFCGSGSTGAAAVQEGRGFLGIEREAGYATIARARIAHWATQPPENLAIGGDPA